MGVWGVKASGQSKLSAKTKPSLRSNGEDVTVELEHKDSHSTLITVTSSSMIALTLIDWGKNKANISRVIESLMAFTGA